MVTTRLSNKKKFDPVSLLPQEIFDEIADYLSEKDVLNCILVSRSWYGAVVRSKSAMSKLTIKYIENSQERYLKLLLESDRPYQNIVFDINGIESHLWNNAEEYYRSLLSKSSNEPLLRKNAKKNLRSILSTFASSIESIDTTNDLKEIFEIPKLKSLTFRDKTGRFGGSSLRLYPHGLLSRAKDIEKLAVNNITYDFPVDWTLIVSNALKMMEKLNYLEIQCPFDYTYIDTRPFSLRTFKNQDFGRPVEESPVIDYLLTHRETLTFIEIGSIEYKREVETILTEFPKLRVLHIRFSSLSLHQYSSWYPEDQKNLPLNETITELKICKWYMSFLLIKSLKSLKNLAIKYLDEEILEYILTSTTIRQVSYWSIDEPSKGSKLYIDMMNSPIKFLKISKMNFTFLP